MARSDRVTDAVPKRRARADRDTHSAAWLGHVYLLIPEWFELMAVEPLAGWFFPLLGAAGFIHQLSTGTTRQESVALFEHA